MKKQICMALSVMMVLLLTLSGCGKRNYNTDGQLKLGVTSDLPLYSNCGLSVNYAVIGADEAVNDTAFLETSSAMLVNDTDKTALVAHNVHARIYPASMTKIMTGIIVFESLENGTLSLDDMVTLDHTVTFDEWNVAASDLVGGCKVSIKDLIYGLLVASYNDCAVILAEQIAGSESAFVDMMNEKAYELGAANTHYVNPHGLHSEDHYTTAYDLYLIFSEFTKHDMAYMIDSTTSYDFTYTDPEGTLTTVTIQATNGFLSGEYNLPEGYSVGSWKSGTTTAAGHCLIMEFINNASGKKYIAVVAKAEDRKMLYSKMTTLIGMAE